MTIDEARQALIQLEAGPVSKDQSFGPQQWVDNYHSHDDAWKARCHEVAWALVHDGSADERRYALAFWGTVMPPQGVADALAELYLGEPVPDANLRAYVGQYTGQPFSDDVGRRLASRFAADPEGERELAINAVRFDAHGAAWDALIRLSLATDDVRRLYHLYNAAYEAGRVDDFLYAVRGKPEALVRELAAVIPRADRVTLGRATGLTLT